MTQAAGGGAPDGHRIRTARLPGLELEEHTVSVPHDHAGSTPGTLEVFARVVGRPGSAEPGAQKPYLLYLQGGPGAEAFRPTRTDPAWLPRALEDYRVVLLDQRGTGRSTPVGIVDGRVTGVPAELAAPPQTDRAAEALADHLAHYRADAIVEDAEILRRALGAQQWSVLGQSFGGFCTLRYLSAHPDGVAEAFFTGGLPAVGAPGAPQPAPADVYARTWATMSARSQAFTQRYPHAGERLAALAARAAGAGISLPDGTLAGPAHVRSLGHLLGASGGVERLLALLDHDIDTAAFRADLLAALPFGARNPLYAVLHESCWASGHRTDWAAARTMPASAAAEPTLLSGEHILPEHFTTGPLQAWQSTAHALAARDWPELWDPAALARTSVPAAAAVYFDDAYVPRELSLATAELVPGLRTWVTNEYEHNGLRASGPAVLDRLIRMVRDEV